MPWRAMVCPKCSAIVDDRAKHRKWHKKNKPIPGPPGPMGPPGQQGSSRPSSWLSPLGDGPGSAAEGGDAP